MIALTDNDVRIIKQIKNNKKSAALFRKIARELCMARDEDPVFLEEDPTLGTSYFCPNEWAIYLASIDEYDFLHEMGHVISHLDRGRIGTEEEVEAFAHGVMGALFSNKYEAAKEIDWEKVEDPFIKKILWIKEQVERWL